ncbi:SAICAR synthetase, partial [Viridothelium virens]
MESSLIKTDLGGKLHLVASGKVRDVYEIDESTLLFVATDRISANDVVLKNGIPTRGALLNILSAHWFSVLPSLIPSLKTHFVTLDLPQSLLQEPQVEGARQLQSRSMQVRRLRALPIESIVRGYITGSAWAEYCKRGTIHGIPVSGEDGAKLKESDQLLRPLWTPSTKAPPGESDENIHPDQAAELVGSRYAKRIEELSLEIYTKARDYAFKRGIIIADTKFEFGVDEETDEVVLIDEVLTPDSSRFWPADEYKPGQSQQSFDKQFLRDWLSQSGLKGQAGVEIPEDIREKTASKYIEVYERLVGKK